MNIIIAPHPDDELIGCSSILERRTPKKVILLTDGGDSVRVADFKKVCKSYGASYELHDFVDGKLKENITSIMDVMSRFATGKNTLYVPSPQELHSDHIACAIAAQALRYKKTYFYTVNNIIKNRKALIRVPDLQRKMRSLSLQYREEYVKLLDSNFPFYLHEYFLKIDL